MARRKRAVALLNGDACKELGVKIKAEIKALLRDRQNSDEAIVTAIKGIIARHGCGTPGDPYLYERHACAMTIHLPDGQWHDINVKA